MRHSGWWGKPRGIVFLGCDVSRRAPASASASASDPYPLHLVVTSRCPRHVQEDSLLRRVLRALPILTAICRSLNPSAFSRRTSRILHTGNLACPAIDLLPLGKRITVAAVIPLHMPRSRILRNGGPTCSGTMARHQLEYAVIGDNGEAGTEILQRARGCRAIPRYGPRACSALLGSSLVHHVRGRQLLRRSTPVLSASTPCRSLRMLSVTGRITFCFRPTCCCCW